MRAPHSAIWQLAGRMLLLVLLLGGLFEPFAQPVLAGGPGGSPPTTGDTGVSLPAAPEWQETGSLLLALLKAVGALALVLALIALLAFVLKKMGWGREVSGRSTLIQVLDTRMIAPKKYVAVLRVASEVVAVGVTDQQITLLTKLEGEDLPDILAAAGKAGPQPRFSSALHRALRGSRHRERDDS